jgi:hypothetical protein
MFTGLQASLRNLASWETLWAGDIQRNLGELSTVLVPYAPWSVFSRLFGSPPQFFGAHSIPGPSFVELLVDIARFMNRPDTTTEVVVAVIRTDSLVRHAVAPSWVGG